MKTLRKNWAKLAGTIGLAGLAMFTLYACVSAWGQSLPGVKMSLTNGGSAVWVTVTNGVSTSKYQIYTKENLDDVDWILTTNGLNGETNFLLSTGDAESQFYRAVLNTNLVNPSLSITITVPGNGANVQ